MWQTGLPLCPPHIPYVGIPYVGLSRSGVVLGILGGGMYIVGSHSHLQ